MIAVEKITTRQLYGQICSGQFDDALMQHIDNEIKTIHDRKKRFGRYDFPEHVLIGTDDRKLQELFFGDDRDEQTFAAASIVCRADESTGTKNPRGVYEGERECAPRQERLLEAWARKAGCWYQLDNLDQDLLISSGGESEVYRYDEDTVLKVNTTRYTVSPQLLLDRIAIHNTLFPDTSMTLLGFGRNDMGEFCLVYTQPFVKGTRPTEDEIKSFLEEKACRIEEYQADGHNYKNAWLLLDDLHDENVIKDHQGRLRVIDSDIRFNTPQLGKGGRLTIPSVEDDYGEDIAKSTMKKSEFENNDNIVQIEGALLSCRADMQDDARITAALEVVTGGADNRIRHRVAVSGADRQTYEALQKRCEENLQAWKADGQAPRSIPISLYGRLVQAGGTMLVAARAEDVSFPRKIHRRGEQLGVNLANIRGELVDKTSNDAYVTAMIRTSKDKTLIPVNIYRKDNPAQWDDLAGGKIKKGDSLRFCGPLVSATYSNGQKTFWRCSVNADRYTVLNRKQDKKTRAALGF